MMNLFSFLRGQGPALGCLAVAAILLAGGCKREQVTEYRVPKEQPAAPEPQASLPEGHDSAAGTQAMALPTLKWAKLPDGWTERTPGSMRVASFEIAGNNGQRAEVGVIPLPSGGNELDLVNMWREQMQLPNVSAADAAKQSESVTIGGEQGKLFEMVSEAPLIPEQQDGPSKFKARILVAMVTRENTSWFFKLTGTDELVAAQKPVFVEFLKGVTFGPPSMALSVPNNAEEDMPAAGEGTALPKWSAPDNWQPQTPGPMVLASFKAGDATVNVSSFPGDVGGLLANVNRWRSQVGQAPLAPDDLETNLTALDGGAKLVDVTGAGAKRLVGAIVPHGGKTWFYKLTGSDAAVTAQKDAFVHFVMNVRYPDAP
jgi:hypothetical protein